LFSTSFTPGNKKWVKASQNKDCKANEQKFCFGIAVRQALNKKDPSGF